jgi:hypothetical protein
MPFDKQGLSTVSTAIASIALVMGNAYAASRTAEGLGHVISICSAGGIRLMRLPGDNPDKRDDCPKACHALCHRSRERHGGG